MVVLEGVAVSYDRGTPVPEVDNAAGSQAHGMEGAAFRRIDHPAQSRERVCERETYRERDEGEIVPFSMRSGTFLAICECLISQGIEDVSL